MYAEYSDEFMLIFIQQRGAIVSVAATTNQTSLFVKPNASLQNKILYTKVIQITGNLIDTCRLHQKSSRCSYLVP